MASNIGKSTPDKLIEFEKCLRDPIYFIDNYVQDFTTPEPVPITLYPKQRKIVEALTNNHFCIILGSRQCGKTVCVEAYMAWLVLFHPNYHISVLSRKGDFTFQIIYEVKRVLQLLKPPFTVEMDDKGQGHSEKNLEGKFRLINKSSINAITVPKENPAEAGRGVRSSFIFIDEASQINHLQKIFTGLGPSTGRVFTRCKKDGIPYGIALAGTPNGMTGIGEYYYLQWMMAEAEQTEYKSIKFHWSEVPEYGEEWYAEQCRKYNYDMRTINQELDLLFLGSDDSFLPDADIKKLQQLELTDPQEYVDIKTGDGFTFKLNIFEKPKEGETYLVGVDPATRSGPDFTCVSVSKFGTGEQVAEYFGKCSVTQACVIAREACRYYVNSIIIAEANGLGNQVVEYCEKDDFLRFRTYYTMIRSGKDFRKKYGMANTNITRPQILDSIYQTVTNNPEHIRSKPLRDQLLGLQNKSGRIEGSPDDAVFAYGFTQCARSYYVQTILNIASSNTGSTEFISNLFTERYGPMPEDDKDAPPPITSPMFGGTGQQPDDLFNTFMNSFMYDTKEKK
jgi:hypothetical protein